MFLLCRLLDSSRPRHQAISPMFRRSVMVAWCCRFAQPTPSLRDTASPSYLVQPRPAFLAQLVDLCLSAEAVTSRNSQCQQVKILSMSRSHSTLSVTSGLRRPVNRLPPVLTMQMCAPQPKVGKHPDD